MTIREHGIDYGILLSGIGIQFTANGFHAVQYVPSATVLRPLKDGVLHKVSQSILSRGVVAAAGIDGYSAPRHARRGLQVNDFESVRECVKPGWQIGFYCHISCGYQDE
jgi:hypothetical protein